MQLGEERETNFPGSSRFCFVILEFCHFRVLLMVHIYSVIVSQAIKYVGLVTRCALFSFRLQQMVPRNLSRS